MENLILEAINYVSKISRQKVTVESISTFLNKKGPTNINDHFITETLKDMQSKGIINKYNRPINLKSPEPSEPSEPTTAEKGNVVNTRNINNSLNKTFPLVPNRSLPATPVPIANTTPRLFSIDNVALNSKLESLESKLYGKIVAMKQFLMDELQSLKRETQLSQTMDSCNEFEDRNILENKIKMLEFENNLLKNDISNKQKFIDTILEHNGKLINNQTSNVTMVKKKTIPDYQEHKDKTSDVEINNEQTHIENYINEQIQTIDEKKDREKNDKENKKSKKGKLPVDNKKKNKKIYILGDSIVKHVEGWQLSKMTNQKVYVRSFSGAKVKCMKDYVKPCIRENDPDHVILHVGTNEMNSELPPERIAKSVVDVAKNVKSDTRSVSISSILPRNDNFNNKVIEVNKELEKMCNKEKLKLIKHDNINPKAHINKSKVHLNRNGYLKLGKNFANFINNNA